MNPESSPENIRKDLHGEAVGPAGGGHDTTMEPVTSVVHPKLIRSIRNASEDRFGLEIIYEVSATACNHYSEVLCSMRSFSVTQGLVILAAFGFLVDGKQRFLAFAVSLFGVAFTLLAFCYRRNYLKHFLGFVKWTEHLESAMVDVPPPHDKIRPGTVPAVGPWNAYNTNRIQRYKNPFWPLTVNLGPTVLFGVIFALCAIWSYSPIGEVWNARFGNVAPAGRSDVHEEAPDKPDLAGEPAEDDRVGRPIRPVSRR